MDRLKIIRQRIDESARLKHQLLETPGLLATVTEVAGEILACYRAGGKALFCGNGGSAADAQHLAAELSGRFYLDRAPLFAEALHVNSSYLTAVANDHSYGEVFSRLVRGMGKPGDVLIGMSTSGNADNVVNAIEAGNHQGMITIGMTGNSGGRLRDAVRYLINVPSTNTPRIQECHMLLGHILCEIVEAELFPDT
jgi:D-sedoheptulose 7-phosphate isomerase